ncbi:MAG: hypothetical protein ACLVA3_03200 [Blautia wexlerae]
MQMVSSYGVEIRKQNIPIRQTLEIYRSGGQLSDWKSMNRYGQN